MKELSGVIVNIFYNIEYSTKFGIPRFFFFFSFKFSSFFLPRDGLKGQLRKDQTPTGDAWPWKGFCLFLPWSTVREKRKERNVRTMSTWSPRHSRQTNINRLPLRSQKFSRFSPRILAILRAFQTKSADFEIFVRFVKLYQSYGNFADYPKHSAQCRRSEENRETFFQS